MTRNARRVPILALCLLVSQSIFAANQLCLRSAEQKAFDCTPTSSAQAVGVQPSATARQAIWIAQDYRRVVVFTIGANDKLARVPLSPNVIRFAVDTRRLARNPRLVEYKLTEKSTGIWWKWSLPARVVTSSISALDGIYSLEVSAEGARPRTVAEITVDTGHRVADAGQFELRSRLTISGRLLDQSGAPVSAASIGDETGKSIGDETGKWLSTSSGDGTFLIDSADEQLPAAITIKADGYAVREVAIPDRRDAFTAGDVVLDRGVPLYVAVIFDSSDTAPAGTSVALFAVRNNRSKQSIARQPLSGTIAKFDHIAHGTYIIDVAGAEPLEHRAVKLEIAADGEKREEIRITPKHLDGHVYFGSDPLSGGTITVYPRTQMWEANQQLDSEGGFGGSLWDDGVFGAIVQGGLLKLPFVTDTTVEKREEAWDIVIPNNSVRGTVVSASTNEGIAGARVLYESVGSRMRLSSFVTGDGEGRFEITGVAEGTLNVRAAAEGYLDSNPVAVQVQGFSKSENHTIALEPGVKIPVQVTDEQDRPVVGAMLVDLILPTARFVTNNAGVAEVPVGSNRPRRVCVVPKEGSFTLLTLHHDDPQPVHAVFTSTTGGVTVKVRTDGDAPFANLGFVVRYNGEVIPEHVWRAVTYLQGFTWVTDSKGEARNPRLPAGTYDLWPYATTAEGQSIAMTPGAIGPVASFRLNPGDDQVITVVLKARK